MRFGPRSLVGQTLLLEVLSLAFLLAVFATLQWRAVRGQVESDVMRSAEATAAAFGEVLRVDPGLLEERSLQQMVAPFVTRIPNIMRVSVVDAGQRVRADSAAEEVGRITTLPEVAQAFANGRTMVQRLVADGRRIVRTIKPIDGAYDPSRRSAMVAAVVIDYNLSAADPEVSRIFLRTLGVVSLLLGLLGIAQYFLIVGGPVQRLTRIAAGARRLGDGALDTRIEIRGQDEIADLAAAFNAMADRIQHAQQVLRTSDQMKSDFVSFASHQLRTPMAGMNWMLELVAETPGLPPEAAGPLQDARASAARLVALVNDLLDVARLESGRVVMDITDVRLDELTGEAAAELRPLADDKQQQFTLQTAPVTVSVDRQLLRQVVLNLLSNAIKYTPAGGTVDVSVSNGAGSAILSVRDTGIGIEPAAQARLFEKFFRADNAVALETEGTGLGLHVVKLVVEQFDGRVSCVSEVGRGSTFEVTLPAISDRPTIEEVCRVAL